MQMLHKQLVNEFIARAKTLSNIMTTTKDIKVTIDGTEAYCSFGHINIPAGDFTDPKFVKMVHGWIDHELGHEDESDRKLMKIAKSDPVLAHLFNIVEDVRMEKSRGLKFRGAKHNLAVLAELAIERGLFTEPSRDKDVGALIFSSILYRGRAKVIGQHCLDDYAQQSIALLIEKTTQPFVDGLLFLIDKMHSLTNSHGALKLAQEILEYIKKEQEQQDQQEQQQAAKSDSSEDGKQSDPNQTNPTTEDEDPVNSQQPTTTDEGDEDDSTSPNDDSDKLSGGSQSDANATPQQSQMTQLIASMQACDIDDYHQKISELINADTDFAKTHQTQDLDVSIVEDESAYIFDSDYLDKPLAKRVSAAVFQALHKAMFDIQPALPVTRKTGKRIINRRLASIPSGNLKVFNAQIDDEVQDAAVSLVIDASPSMGFGNMKAANTCALAFAYALQRLSIAFEVVHYGATDENRDRWCVTRAKRFDERINPSRFQIDSNTWGTPTGQAMKFALSSLAVRTENNKIMVLITDGDASDAEDIETSRDIAKALGIRIVPLGLQTGFVHGFDSEEFVSLDDSTQLASAVRQAIKQKLFA